MMFLWIASFYFSLMSFGPFMECFQPRYQEVQCLLAFSSLAHLLNSKLQWHYSAPKVYLVFAFIIAVAMAFAVGGMVCGMSVYASAGLRVSQRACLLSH
jgi:hypothetical protein